PDSPGRELENLRRFPLRRFGCRFRHHPLIHIDRQKAGLGHHPSPEPRPQMQARLPADRVTYQFAPGQLRFFEQSSKSTGNDYLVAFANPARLVKIAHGERINSVSKTQWIGDQEAYSRFREYEARQHPRPEQGRAINAVLFADEMANSPASDLFSAMRNIAANRSIMTAGGLRV